MMGAASGQWIDSPSGRVARAQEIDAAWQQIWRDQYSGPSGHNVPEELRAQFTEDYYTWQRIKEALAKMGALSLMSPATGDLLDRWAVRSRDWHERMKEAGVQLTAPAPTPRLQRDSGWVAPTRFAWALAAAVTAAAALAAVHHLASRKAAA